MQQIRRQIGEAVVWCVPRASLRDPRRSLREPMLEPSGAVSWPEAVQVVLQKRKALLNEGLGDIDAEKLDAVREAYGPSGGRLLVYRPNENLFDGAAEVETRGYFNVDNVPPWDSWCGFLETPPETLIAWVPPVFLRLVARGIDVNPEQCIGWAEDLEPRLSALIKLE